MKRVFLALACGSIVAAALLGAAGSAAARGFPPPAPFASIQLAQLGYGDDTLQGPLVSADWFIPGPADFLLGAPKSGDVSYLDMDVIPSELLTKESVLVVYWNGVPISDRQIGATSGARERFRVAVPFELIDPEVNRLSVQAQLRLAIDTCEAGSVDSPARHLTIMSSSTVTYSYAQPLVPEPAPVRPDLASYPLPFFSPTHPQPAPVRIIVPDSPSATELTALGEVATQLGQYAGDRGLKVELQRASDVHESDLASTHVILLGKRSSLPLLRGLQGAPLGQDGSGFLDASRRPIPEDSGVVMVMPSPWSPARGLLVVSGTSDAAVGKAALALAGRDGIAALRGTYAIVPDAAPYAAPAAAATVATRLSDLGHKDEQVNGVGDHAISFTAFLPSVPRDASVALDLAVSHSGLLDQDRSSMRIVVNDLPLESVAFRDLPPVHAIRRIDLPGAALRPGANALRVEFSLRLPGLAARDACNAVPVEQAWAVLHADTSILPPSGPDRGAAEPSLDTYPYPFNRNGRLDDVLVVVPPTLGQNAQALAQYLCDLGRTTRAGLLRPAVVTSDAFDPKRDALNKDVILFGLPQDDRAIGDLGAQLPVVVGTDQRLVLGREITVRVADLERLGVVEEIPSPWSPGRTVLVVSGTSAEGLDYAVEAVRQRALSGNVVVATLQQPRAPVAGAIPTPKPIAFGGPAPIPLDVSSYRLRPQILAPQQQTRPPWVLIAAGIVAAIAVLIVAAQSYAAFRAGEDRS
ncbi:MAG: cellulose biosynthesis cyclic di-GMP-binding regulatory protein BcsB [Chloroflexota bacterium]|nr:cellulose biosynthesis cyclic di-GMP-binding regulatory protein BcsB [Chloroflexota bacterium]